MLAPKTTCRITASSRASTAACDELLNETLFTSLAQARVTTALWRADYNTARPHSQIAWQTPDEFARTFTPRRSLALRNANGSAQEPATSTAQQGKTTAGNELKTGQNAGATSVPFFKNPTSLVNSSSRSVYPQGRTPNPAHFWVETNRLE